MIEFKTNLFSITGPLFKYLDKQKENQKTLDSIELAVTFFLISIFAFFAIKPAVVTISGLVGDIQAKQAQSTAMRQKINQIVQAQDSFSQIEANYKLIESALPSTPRYTQAAIQFQVLGQNQNIDTSKINFSLSDKSKKDNQNPASYSINFSNKADFPKIVALIKEIYQNRRLNSIVNFNISKAKDSPQITFSFNSIVYYWTNYVSQ